MSERADKIAVLGAGSWGTALAIGLAHNQPVCLWGHSPDEVAALERDRENKQFLPGVALPPGLTTSTDLASCVANADEILIVVPSHAFASICAQLAALDQTPQSLSWATKGFDPESGALLSEVARKHFPTQPLAVVSGPTFAMEAAKGMPTALAVASSDAEHAARLANYLRSDTLRAYTSDDPIGVQVGGACKNIMAIAAGVADGLGFGANTRAALITRGLAEITRLGLALGGQLETFMGLTGIGDLTLTCTDDQSRNRRMGLAIAKGASIEAAKQAIGQEVEGVGTTREVYNKARSLGVEMPLTEQAYRVLYQGLDPREAVQQLLTRAARPE